MSSMSWEGECLLSVLSLLPSCIPVPHSLLSHLSPCLPKPYPSSTPVHRSLSHPVLLSLCMSVCLSTGPPVSHVRQSVLCPSLLSLLSICPTVHLSPCHSCPPIPLSLMSTCPPALSPCSPVPCFPCPTVPLAHNAAQSPTNPQHTAVQLLQLTALMCRQTVSRFDTKECHTKIRVLCHVAHRLLSSWFSHILS